MTGERAVDGLSTRLGPEDPLTLTAMFNLARTYFRLGEEEKSHELLVWVLKLQKKFFGMKHPDALMTRNELGMLLCASKRHLHAAQRLVENVLETRKQILGEEHAYTLWSVNDLSKVLVERGRPDEAVTVLENIIPIVERTLGEDHVGMSMTRSNLGKAYFMSGRWKEAEKIIRPLLAKILPDHPDWIHNMFGYAHIKFKLGELQEAGKYCVEIMDKIMRTKKFSLDDPRTLSTAELLLSIYRLQKREEEIAAIEAKVPHVGLVRNEDRFDPYAVRRGSGQLPQLRKSISSNEHPRPESSPKQVKSQASSQNELQRRPSKPRLIVRRTF